MSTKILVVEDDPNMGEHLMNSLQVDGFSAQLLRNRTELEASISAAQDIDVVLLDRLLDSFDCKVMVPKIRETWPEIRILVLSAINTPNERTELLNLGADDYMGKPFTTQEVVARINALRRRASARDVQSLRVGNTAIDLVTRAASVGDKEDSLPAKEFLLLKTLAQTPGRVLNKTQLLEQIWGAGFDSDSNVVEATLTNLRRRLQNLGSSVKIKNMRNTGYWVED